MWSLRGGTVVQQQAWLGPTLAVTLSGTRLLGLVCRGDQQLTGFGCPGFASKKNGPAFARGHTARFAVARQKSCGACARGGLHGVVRSLARRGQGPMPTRLPPQASPQSTIKALA